MKTYDITIVGLTRSKVLDVITSLPSGSTFKCVTHGTDEPTPIKTNGHLSLTGKKASPNSQREEVLVVFEKLEKKHGIGNVTRDMLKEQCDKMDVAYQIIYQLVGAGYLRYN